LGDLHGQHDPLDALTDLADIQLREGYVVGTAPRYQHMVHRAWQVGEEAHELIRVTEIERRGARTELEADSMQPIRVAGRQDHVRSRLTSAPGRLQPDSRGAAEHHDRLALEPPLLGVAPAHVACPVTIAGEPT
jgi:hypothetical protein